jgi:hypothetical protein
MQDTVKLTGMSKEAGWKAKLADILLKRLNGAEASKANIDSIIDGMKSNIIKPSKAWHNMQFSEDYPGHILDDIVRTKIRKTQDPKKRTAWLTHSLGTQPGQLELGDVFDSSTPLGKKMQEVKRELDRPNRPFSGPGPKTKNVQKLMRKPVWRDPEMEARARLRDKTEKNDDTKIWLNKSLSSMYGKPREEFYSLPTGLTRVSPATQSKMK